MHAVHDLNGLDAYTLCTVHEHDLVVARNESKNYMHTNVIRAYVDLVLLVSISQNFSSSSNASIKFKLSCAVCMYTVY